MLQSIINIFHIAFIQATYDLMGWNKNEFTFWEVVLFRTVKFILDYPVSCWVMLQLHWSSDQIAAFYVAKQMGLCDMIYMLQEAAVNKDKMDLTGLWWLWWSFPLGLFRTLVSSFKAKYFRKGEVTLVEFAVQVMLGLVLSQLVIKFSLFSGHCIPFLRSIYNFILSIL